MKTKENKSWLFFVYVGPFLFLALCQYSSKSDVAIFSKHCIVHWERKKSQRTYQKKIESYSFSLWPLQFLSSVTDIYFKLSYQSSQIGKQDDKITEKFTAKFFSAVLQYVASVAPWTTCAKSDWSPWILQFRPPKQVSYQ